MFLFYVNPILIAAAVIPAIVLLRFVYKEDRLDKESPGLLLSLVIFGILSTFAAIVTEQIGETVLTLLLPVLLHGTYDFIATYEYDGYAWIFVAFVVMLFAAAYRMIKKLSRDDRFIGGSDYYHYDGPEF